MRVAIFGVGGVGQVSACEIVKSKYLKKLVLADISIGPAEELAAELRRETDVEIQVKRVDARDVSSVQNILHDIDVLLHIGLPENNFDVMKACLNTKTH